MNEYLLYNILIIIYSSFRLQIKHGPHSNQRVRITFECLNPDRNVYIFKFNYNINKEKISSDKSIGKNKIRKMGSFDRKRKTLSIEMEGFL